jgi:L-alanine-DL-glutamate epimerase-like enolase superfamily enzyme
MLAIPLDVDPNGYILLPDRPGMGYELAEDVLRKTRLG